MGSDEAGMALETKGRRGHISDLNGFGLMTVVSQIRLINTKWRSSASLGLSKGFLNYKREMEYAQTNGSQARSEANKCMSTCVFMESKLGCKSRNKR